MCVGKRLEETHQSEKWLLWDYQCFRIFFLKLCNILQITVVNKNENQGLVLLEIKSFIMHF